MSVLPPEPERRPALRQPDGPRVATGARPDAFSSARGWFDAPPAPAVGRAPRRQTRGEYVARLLRRTRRVPAKAMVDMDDPSKDSPASWDDFHRRLASKQQVQLAAAERDPQPTAARERSGLELPVGPQLEAALEATGDIAFAKTGQQRETTKVVGPLAFALARTEVRAGPRRSERAGLLDWSNPPSAEELATPPEQRLRGAVPDTAHMSTAFGGSSGRGIFVLTQGQLHVTDTARYAEMFGGGGIEAYHSSITGGRPVDAAGEIEIRDGRVLAISNLSGHYRPDPEHLLNTLSWLAGRGIDVSGVKVGVLDKEYDAVRFVEAGGDVTALEADGLRARGVAITKDPATGRTTASVTHPKDGILPNLTVASQQRILAQPAGTLSPGTLGEISSMESDARALQSAAQPAAAGPRARPSEQLRGRRETLSRLLPGRRRNTVAPIRDRFSGGA